MIKNEFRFEYMIETLIDGTQFLHCLSYQNNCLIDDSNLGKVVDIMKENKQLKERIEYLERSIARKEDTIEGYIHETVELDKYKEVIEEAKTAVDYMIGNVDISEIHGTKLKQILDNAEEN